VNFLFGIFVESEEFRQEISEKNFLVLHLPAKIRKLTHFFVRLFWQVFGLLSFYQKLIFPTRYRFPNPF